MSTMLPASDARLMHASGGMDMTAETSTHQSNIMLAGPVLNWPGNPSPCTHAEVEAQEVIAAPLKGHLRQQLDKPAAGGQVKILTTQARI